MSVELKPLPPAEAIAFFRAKGLITGFAWEDVWQEEHARAFTVAKAMQREVLEDIRAALDAALVEGTTLDQFRKDLTPTLQARGWWGRQEMEDPLTGETREVQLGSPRRLRTIFETNMRSAYQAGRWQRIESVKTAMPYLRYVAVQDSRTRPEHRAWHGTVLPVDDPWWDAHYPPCGFRCRCTVTQMNGRTLARRGFTVTEEPIRFPARTYTNRRTGEVTTVEGGIAPGFSYNVGKAYLDGVTPRPIPDAPDRGGGGEAADSASAQAASLERPGDLLEEGATIDEAAAAFLAELDAGVGRIVADPTGFGLAVGPALFRRLDGAAPAWPDARVRSLQLVARAIAAPDEIREVWADTLSGRRQLVRRYTAAFDTPEGLVEVVAELGTDGWRCRSSAETTFSDWPSGGGAVVYRRTAP